MNKNRIPYLSILSHELKSPINTIINIAKTIELSLNKSSEEKIKDYISLIISQAVYLKNYISNTIELGKLQTGKEDVLYEEFDLVEIFHEIVEITKIMIENKMIQIKTLFPAERFIIQSDPVKIKQILLNIASNSAKFTRKGYILFTFEADDKNIIIKIEDTGKGIPEEMMDKLFNPYCSFNTAEDRIFDSSGLGLYITKELLNLLGGNISIKSERGKGTAVHISIPIRNEK